MKFKAVLGIAAVVITPSAFAQSAEEKARIRDADNACAIFATQMVTGMRSLVMNKETSFRLCNSHPTKIACTSTRSYIEENMKDVSPDERKAIPLLTCDGS
jgi:hypothetical protein